MRSLPLVLLVSTACRHDGTCELPDARGTDHASCPTVAEVRGTTVPMFGRHPQCGPGLLVGVVRETPVPEDVPGGADEPECCYRATYLTASVLFDCS